MSQISVTTPHMDVSIVKNYHPVLNPAGTPLPIYRDRGGYFYVEAPHGLEYAIRTTNKQPFSRETNERLRLEVVGSVDGRNTLKNAPADIYDSRGLITTDFIYVIPGYGQENTSPFVFTMLDREAMAVKVTDTNEKLGVIAVCCYRELVVPQRRPQQVRPDTLYRGGLESFTMDQYGVKGLDLREVSGVGTKMGDRVDHRDLGTTSFTRLTSRPEGFVEIFAKPRRWLIEKGIITDGNIHDSDHPSGFSNRKPDYFD